MAIYDSLSRISFGCKKLKTLTLRVFTNNIDFHLPNLQIQQVTTVIMILYIYFYVEFFYFPVCSDTMVIQ